MSDIEAVIEPEAGEEAAAAPAAGRKRLMLAGGGALALLLAGGGAWFAFAGSGQEAEVAEPTYVEMPDMLVNMRTADGRPRFLKVKVVIEMPDEAASARLEKKMPVLVDRFQSFLRETRPEDLAGASGTYRIKEELLGRAAATARPDRVSDVLVQELVQQ